jgi:hypothetical protein
MCNEREVLVRFYLRDESPQQICSDLGLTDRQFRNFKCRAKGRFAALCRASMRQRQKQVAPQIKPAVRTAATYKRPAALLRDYMHVSCERQ